jgi:hypothetical protein
MNAESLRKVVTLAERVGHVLVATASAGRLPHVAAAGKVALRSDGRAIVADWFCPGTMNNLRENRLITLVVWDSAADTGYQLLGELEAVNDLAVLDGYAYEEAQAALPQVERELVIRVDEMLAFSQGPHSDAPIHEVQSRFEE